MARRTSADTTAPDAEFPTLPPRPAPEAAVAPAKSRGAAASNTTSGYRCLACGYPLMEQGGFRCSECGVEFEEADLRAWFDGQEASRFQLLLWLVGAVFFLKLWVLAPLAPYGRMLAAGAVFVAALSVGRGKSGTVGHYWAVSAGVCGVLMFIFMGSGGPFHALPYLTVELCAAAALLQAALHDSQGRAVMLPVGTRYFCVAALVTAPLLAMALDAAQRGLDAANVTSGWPESYPLFRFIVPTLLTLGLWTFVVRKIWLVRQRLFAPIADRE